MKHRVLIVLLLAASPVWARQRGAKLGPPAPAKTVETASPTPDASPAAPLTPPSGASGPAVARPEPVFESKVVHYSEKDVVHLKTKVRYTTLIVLPKSEKILDFSTGDREFWVIEGSDNFAYVKPSKANAHTNLNLITASGNIYSFSLTEISEAADTEPDLKVFVDLKDDSMLSAASGPQRFIPVSEIDRYRKEADVAKEETRRVKQITEETIEKGVDKILSRVRCQYEFKKNKKPFYVATICHDDKFTYISMAPEETPALYDMREGENLVNFTYKPIAPTSLRESRPNSGIVTIQKVVQNGYIAIGKERLYFSIKE